MATQLVIIRHNVCREVSPRRPGGPGVHAEPGQKNRKVLAQLIYKVLVSVKFNMTFIYSFLIKPSQLNGLEADTFGASTTIRIFTSRQE